MIIVDSNEYHVIKLEQGEKILFQEEANPNKVDKQIGKFLLLSAVLTFFWFITIRGIVDVINISAIGILFTMIIVTVVAIYGFINNFFLVRKKKGEKYFITNKRIIIVNKGKFVEKNIFDINQIDISNEKKDYGNLTFNSYDGNLYTSIKNSIGLIGIKNARTIVQTIVNLNNNIHVYDDKPTGIFSKKGK